MDLNFEPWTRYEALTEPRLVEVANLLRRIRCECVTLHDTSAGDDAWCLSCRVYSRSCNALRKMAKDSSWLSILEDEEQPQRFVFAIGGIPFRFYHGEAGDPPDHYRIVTYAELHQQQTVLDFGGVPVKDKMLRLAAETDESLLISCVTLVEMDRVGKLTGVYIVPERASDTNVEPMRRDGVVVPKPNVKPISHESQNKKENKRRDGGTR